MQHNTKLHTHTHTMFQQSHFPEYEISNGSTTQQQNTSNCTNWLSRKTYFSRFVDHVNTRKDTILKKITDKITFLNKNSDENEFLDTISNTSSQKSTLKLPDADIERRNSSRNTLHSNREHYLKGSPTRLDIDPSEWSGKPVIFLLEWIQKMSDYLDPDSKIKLPDSFTSTNILQHICQEADKIWQRPDLSFSAKRDADSTLARITADLLTATQKTITLKELKSLYLFHEYSLNSRILDDSMVQSMKLHKTLMAHQSTDRFLNEVINTDYRLRDQKAELPPKWILDRLRQDITGINADFFIYILAAICMPALMFASIVNFKIRQVVCIYPLSSVLHWGSYVWITGLIWQTQMFTFCQVQIVGQIRENGTVIASQYNKQYISTLKHGEFPWLGLLYFSLLCICYAGKIKEEWRSYVQGGQHVGMSQALDIYFYDKWNRIDLALLFFLTNFLFMKLIIYLLEIIKFVWPALYAGLKFSLIKDRFYDYDTICFIAAQMTGCASLTLVFVHNKSLGAMTEATIVMVFYALNYLVIPSFAFVGFTYRELRWRFFILLR